MDRLLAAIAGALIVALGAMVQPGSAASPPPIPQAPSPRVPAVIVHSAPGTAARGVVAAPSRFDYDGEPYSGDRGLPPIAGGVAFVVDGRSIDAYAFARGAVRRFADGPVWPTLALTRTRLLAQVIGRHDSDGPIASFRISDGSLRWTRTGELFGAGPHVAYVRAGLADGYAGVDPVFDRLLPHPILETCSAPPLTYASWTILDAYACGGSLPRSYALLYAGPALGDPIVTDEDTIGVDGPRAVLRNGEVLDVFVAPSRRPNSIDLSRIEGNGTIVSSALTGHVVWLSSRGRRTPSSLVDLYRIDLDALRARPIAIDPQAAGLGTWLGVAAGDDTFFARNGHLVRLAVNASTAIAYEYPGAGRSLRSADRGRSRIRARGRRHDRRCGSERSALPRVRRRVLRSPRWGGTARRRDLRVLRRHRQRHTAEPRKPRDRTA
jgi:hypothetical protein